MNKLLSDWFDSVSKQCSLLCITAPAGGSEVETARKFLFLQQQQCCFIWKCFAFCCHNAENNILTKCIKVLRNIWPNAFWRLCVPEFEAGLHWLTGSVATTFVPNNVHNTWQIPLPAFWLRTVVSVKRHSERLDLYREQYLYPQGAGAAWLQIVCSRV